jgi:hypothetical protein
LIGMTPSLLMLTHWQESETGNVDLSQDDPAAVEAMYSYLYKYDYSEFAKDDTNAMLLHVQVYCLARTYEVNILKDVVAELFRTTANDYFSIRKFPAIIKEIYDNRDETDTVLREVAVQAAIENHEELLADKDGEFWQMMSEVGEFGRDVFRATPTGTGKRKTPDMKLFYCPRQKIYFKVDVRNAYQAFNDNMTCPGCQAKMDPALAQVETGTKLVCSDCETVWETNVPYSDTTSLWCPGCCSKVPHFRPKEV